MGIKRKFNKISAPNVSEQQWLTNHAAASALAYKNHVYSVYTDKLQLDRQWRHHRTIHSELGLKCNIYVNERTGGVLVAFRGTSTTKEAKIDLMVGKEKFMNVDGKVFGEVYRGFNNAFTEILPTLKNELSFLYNTTYLRKGALEFTGHSLGGALSDLCSTYFGDLYKDVKIINTTFASPSVGDANYVRYASQPNVFRTRVICVGDPISNIKIPGTEFTEKNNVIELVKDHKKWKSSILNLTKALGGIVPALGIGAYEAKQRHSLDTIIDELEDSLKSSRFKTQIVENTILNDDIDNYNEQFQRSQEKSDFDNNTDLGDKPCQCECHKVDDEHLKNNGTPEEEIAKRAKDLLSTQTVLGNGQAAVSSNTYGQVLDQTEAEAHLLSELNQLNANKLPEDIIESIESSLNNDIEKKKSTINKLVDEYQMLLKPVQKEDEDLYSFTKTKEKEQREQVEDIDRQIEFELDHPESLTKDSPAFKLKEEFNQLYKNIQSAAGSIETYKSGLAALNNKYLDKAASTYTNKTEEEKNKLAEEDQQEQRQLAASANNLNDIKQGDADVILNYALIDPNNKEEETKLELTEDQRKILDNALSSYGTSSQQIKNNPLSAERLAEVKSSLSSDARLILDQLLVPEDIPKEFFSDSQRQLREWLNYPGMTPQKLFDLLKKQKLEIYKEQRRVNLIVEDRNLKTKSLAELNQKINKLSQDELVTDESTGKVSIKNGYKNLESDINRKREFMKKVYSNTEVQKIFRTGRITSDQLFKSYTLEKSDDEQLVDIFKDLLGYDPALVSKQNQDKYDKTVFEITTSDKTDSEKFTLLNEAETTLKARQQYPWLSDNQLDALLKKYKDDPQLMQAVVQEMSQQRWNNIAYNKSGDFKVDPTLTRAINQLTYQSTNEGTYTDIGEGLNRSIENTFSNPSKMKELFAQWDRESKQQQGDNEFINKARFGIGVLLNPFQAAAANQRIESEKNAGWYDKYGNKVGTQVPKVFADWASRTGAYSYKPVTSTDSTIQKLSDLWNGLETTFIGISSSEISDQISKFAGKTNYTEQTGIIDDGTIKTSNQNFFNQEHFYHLLLQNTLGAKVVPGYTDFSSMISIT